MHLFVNKDLDVPTCKVGLAWYVDAVPDATNDL